MPLDTHFAIGNFISNALRGGPIQVKGDGSAIRSYLYASDLAVWLWTMLFKGQSARAYNVGSEDALNIAALAHEVAAASPTKVGVKIGSAPQPGATPHRYVPSTARAREELGLQVEVPLREAIRRTQAWFAAETSTAQAHQHQVLSTRGAHA